MARKDEFRVGVVYAQKGRNVEARREGGVQAWRYCEDGLWEPVFCLDTDEGLLWFTKKEKNEALAQSIAGSVYAGRASMRLISAPVPLQEGWLQEGKVWKRRIPVGWLNGEWVRRRIINHELQLQRNATAM